jgi:hypothetical protein
MRKVVSKGCGGRLLADQAAGKNDQKNFIYADSRVSTGQAVKNTAADNGWNADKNHYTQFPADIHDPHLLFTVGFGGKTRRTTPLEWMVISINNNMLCKAKNANFPLFLIRWPAIFQPRTQGGPPRGTNAFSNAP